MAGSRYSSQELFILRNHIPVDDLIKELEIAWKMSEGHFRFCCPACKEFNTAVNPKTNLGRCFSCSQNYNTIDLVMLVTGSNFIQSVKYLKRFHSRKDKPRILYHPPNRKSPSIPVSIGDVLKSIEIQNNNRKKITSKSQTSDNTVITDDILKRVHQLEQKVENLTQKIKLMKNNS